MKILFIDGTKGFDPSRLENKATGGILTSLTIIPRLLAKHGHNVYVKSVFDRHVTIEGVNYLSFKDESPNMDIVVFNRNVLNHDLVNQARKTGAKLVWWLHDIVDHRYLSDNSFMRIPHIVSLSDYCTKTYSQYYDIPTERFSVIPNGVDSLIFNPGNYSKRDPNLFIFASAPIKGMKPLAFTLDNLKRRNPKARLLVYSSQSIHELRDDAIVSHWMQQLRDSGAEIMSPIPQNELAEVFKKAWALLMPNSYPEICSNLLLQAQACGLPVVTSPIGSAAEFISHRNTGLLTKAYPHDLYFWWADFCRQVMELTIDGSLHKKISDQSSASVRSWEFIGEMWHKYIIGITSYSHSVIQEEAIMGGV